MEQKLIAYIYGSRDGNGKFHMGGPEFKLIAGPENSLDLLQARLIQLGWLLPLANIGLVPESGIFEDAIALTGIELETLRK